MIKFLINRPIAVLMTFLGLAILGALSSINLPVSLLPDTDIPKITVRITYPNFSAREIENTVSKGLRKQLMECYGADKVNSRTTDGHSVIVLEFKYGTNIDFAAIEVNEKIDQAMSWLPREMMRPKIIKSKATDIPLLQLSIYRKKAGGSADFLQLSNFVNNVISKRIEQMDEVAFVDMTGIVNAEILIKPNVEQMSAMGITEDNLNDVFNQNNLPIGNIAATENNLQYNIRLSSSIKTPDDLSGIFFNVSGKIIQLKDFATVSVVPQQKEGLFVIDGNRGISLAVVKHEKAKVADLKEKINQAIRQFEIEYPDLQFDISQDQSTLLDYSISNLKSTLIIGGSLAFLVVLVFMWKLNLSFIVALTMPVCLLISLLFFLIFKISINVISLSGLILGIGLIIDNSIIVIDNITQYREKGNGVEDSCIRGVNEVIFPLLASTLTTCSVFLPLIFVSGIAGELFFDQAMGVSIGLGISFFCSITFIPVLYFIIFKDKPILVEVPASKHFQGFEKLYHRGLEKVFNYPKSTITICGIYLVSGYFAFDLISKEAFPKYPQHDTVLALDWNENITISENRKRSEQLIDALGQRVRHSIFWIGMQDYQLSVNENSLPSETKFYIDTRSEKELDEIKTLINAEMVRKFPNAIFTFRSSENVFENTFSDAEGTFVLKVNQKQHDNSLKEAEELYHFLSENIGEKIKNQISKKQYTAIELDYERIILYRLSVEDLFKKLNNTFKPRQIGTIKSYSRLVPVVIGVPNDEIKKLLYAVKIKNKNGVEIPIKDLIELKEVTDLKSILADQDEEYVSYEFDIPFSKKENFEKQLTKKLDSYSSKLNYSFNGKLYSFSKYVKEFTVILVISILLLYFILAAQFESLLQPLILLIEIPIDISAALWILYAFGESFNIMSAIGIIVMTGIIINDSILKIDVINHLFREKGFSIMDAIYEGGKRRFRPIVMTSLTTLLAIIPGLFSSDIGSILQRPMIIALSGGLTIGSVVSLYLIPLLYWYIYRPKQNKKVIEDGQ